MKAAQYYHNHDVRLQEVPVPDVGPADLLVEMKACGLCSSDTLEWYRRPRAPMFLGHEATGVVVQAGPDVTTAREGDRVYVHHHVPCYNCHYCDRGHPTMCDTYHRTRLEPGGFAEYYRTGARNTAQGTIHLSASMDFVTGTLIEPVSCCIRGLRTAGVQPGDTVAIVGSGFNGLIHLELAQRWGARRTIVLDLLDWKLERARQLGADYTVNPSRDSAVEAVRDATDGRGVDTVVAAAGNVKATELGLSLLARGGTLYIYGPASPDTPLSLDISRVFFSEIRLIPSYSSLEADTHLACQMLEEGTLRAADLVTHTLPLERIQEAFALVADARESLKVIITQS